LRGRDRELRILDDLRDALRNGRSASIVIRGEAGIGKTALLRSLAANAEPDFRLVEVAGVESEGELAYAGLHQLCLPLLGHLDALPDPQRAALSIAFGMSEGSAPDRLFVALATLGLLAEAAEKQPLMCLIDDAQWLDDASCEVLGFVARRLAAESVAVVFAMRARREGNRLPDLPEISLGGVAEDDARALLATVVQGPLDEGVRDRLIAETHGNPLALLELPRGMSAAELAGGFGVPTARGVAAHMEDHYVQRVRRLPEPTQRLMLLGAADAVGDATTIWRAASTLGIGTDAAEPAADEHLFEIGASVRFHHPLVRSAVYRSASAANVREAHKALADATDPVADPDRRAWHRAYATEGPDRVVADELERGAERAQARGGLVAAAALLERSASLTPDQSVRVERRLAAARCNLRAGAFDAARRLLAVADAEAAEEFARARIEMLRGAVAAASGAGNDATPLLLQAAKRLETLDPQFAHHTYTDAWGAAMWAGHLANPGADLVAVSRAFQAAPWPPVPRRPFGLINDGLMMLVSDGRAAAEPLLRQGLSRLPTTDIPADNRLRWGALAQVAAAAIWDFDAWVDVSEQLVKLARGLGALAILPRPLNALVLIATLRGDCTLAAALAAEQDAIQQATGTRAVPYGAMLLAAYQGRDEEASSRIATMTEDSMNRREGLGVDLARWAAAILNNGAGRYEEALETASPSNKDMPGVLVATWMLAERIEAATRCGEIEDAASALREFERDANPGESDWRLGIESRLRAMLSEGSDAERMYRESIACLRRVGLRAELARSQLLFGEWLRRENRRIEAREELRAALDIFVAMSASGFAERTRRELLATGAHVRPRRDDTRTHLTPQEEQIARLARDGRTNPEIAAELFISARTVEWHLSKVFGKLGISSRRELKDA
jgi:DNA-binding CsgD family transcriptional regulator